MKNLAVLFVNDFWRRKVVRGGAHADDGGVGGGGGGCPWPRTTSCALQFMMIFTSL